MELHPREFQSFAGDKSTSILVCLFTRSELQGAGATCATRDEESGVVLVLEGVSEAKAEAEAEAAEDDIQAAAPAGTQGKDANRLPWSAFALAPGTLPSGYTKRLSRTDPPTPPQHFTIRQNGSAVYGDHASKRQSGQASAVTGNIGRGGQLNPRGYSRTSFLSALGESKPPRNPYNRGRPEQMHLPTIESCCEIFADGNWENGGISGQNLRIAQHRNTLGGRPEKPRMHHWACQQVRRRQWG